MGAAAAHAPKVKAALATLRKRLDFECTEVDAQGRYCLDFDTMSEVIDAIDDIEEGIEDADAEDDE